MSELLPQFRTIIREGLEKHTWEPRLLAKARPSIHMEFLLTLLRRAREAMCGIFDNNEYILH